MNFTKDTKNKSKNFILGVVLLILLLIIARYSKWEFLSYKYSQEFNQAISSDLQQGCLIEEPDYIKVLDYSSTNAELFMKGVSGTTWLITMKKVNAKWTQIDSQSNVCHNKIINTTRGGSADGIYWYW